VLAVGVLVDDPIVVVEYAERKLAEGMSRKEAFIEAAKKMFVPVVGATATTLGAFVPLLFWPGIIGKFMSYLPIVVIVVMCASLLSALVFMPIIGSMIARAHIDPEEKEAADIVMYADKFDPKKIKGFTGHYVRMLSHLVRHPLPTLAVGFGIIIGIFMWYGSHPTGMEAFPASEAEYGTVAVVGIGNYSPNEIRDLLATVEQRIISVPGIEEVAMKFGGNQNGGGSLPPNTIGNFQLQLMPYNDRVKAEIIFQNIRDKVKDIPGLDIQIMAQENGPPAGKAINLRVESNTYADLAPVVGQLRNFIENDLGDAVDIEDGRPSPGIDWQITIDRVEAAKYGIGVRELSPYVQLVTGGVKIGTYRPDDATDELDIRVRLPEAERSFAALDSMRIATSQGLVPVSNFILRKAVPKVANITRRNSVYVMNVAANLTPGAVTADKVKEVQAWVAKQTFPSDVKIVYGGAEEQTSETNAFIMKAMVGALSLICFVLLLEYNSFYQVLVTLTTIVMSIAGVLLGMSITGMSFSAIMTGIGIVALAGIVVKNSIVLIDTYNHYARGEGVEPTKAMLITAAQRVRPVLLTATVTALGVIPMALNIEFDFIRREIVVGGLAGSWFIHLSAALVSGLLFSTLLTLIMVPVMITAPSVWWRQIKAFSTFFGSLFGALGQNVQGMFGRKSAVTPDGDIVDIPVTANSADKYMNADGTGLVETETNGVTVVSRQAAE
jgi:multidrug efflux pump